MAFIDDDQIVATPYDSGTKYESFMEGDSKLTVIHKEEMPLQESSLTVFLELTGAGSVRERSGVDIVAVLDVSEGMAGEKLSELKTAVNFLIDKLSPADRLSIVSFSKDAKRLCPLRQMTVISQAEIMKLVNDLDVHPGKDITAGLKIALQVIKDRSYSNGRVAAIMLMSDGNESQGSAASSQLFSGKIPVYTFGIGYDQNQSVLNAISRSSGGGTFSMLSSDLSSSFSQCLAVLLGVCVEDLKLTVKKVGSGEINKVFGGNYPSTPYKSGGTVTFTFGNLNEMEIRKVKVVVHLQSVSGRQRNKVLQISYSCRTAGKFFESSSRFVTVARSPTFSKDDEQKEQNDKLQLAYSKGLYQAVSSMLPKIPATKLPTLKFRWGSPGQKPTEAENVTTILGSNDEPEAPEGKHLKGSNKADKSASHKPVEFVPPKNNADTSSDHMGKQQPTQIRNSAIEQLGPPHTTLMMTEEKQGESSGDGPRHIMKVGIADEHRNIPEGKLNVMEENPLLKTLDYHLKQAVKSGKAIQDVINSALNQQSSFSGTVPSADINIHILSNHLAQAILSIKAIQGILVEYVKRKEVPDLDKAMFPANSSAIANVKEAGSSSSSQAISNEDIIEQAENPLTEELIEQGKSDETIDDSIFAMAEKLGIQMFNMAGVFANKLGSLVTTLVKTKNEKDKPTQPEVPYLSDPTEDVPQEDIDGKKSKASLGKDGHSAKEKVVDHLKQAIKSSKAIQDVISCILNQQSVINVSSDTVPAAAVSNMDILSVHLTQAIESIKAVQEILLEYLKEAESSNSSQAASNVEIIKEPERPHKMPIDLKQQLRSFFNGVMKQESQILNAGVYAMIMVVVIAVIIAVMRRVDESS